MQLSDFATKKNAELIAFAKEKLGKKVPSDIDSMERPVLLEVVKSIVEQEKLETEQAPRAAVGSKTAPVDDKPTGSVAEKIETAEDALDALRVMGFDSVEKVKAYLKGVEREKANQLKRVQVIEEMQAALDQRQIKLDKREEAINKAGEKALADKLAARAEKEKNAELLRHREALSKLS